MTTVLIDGYASSDGSQVRGIGTFLHRLIDGLSEHPGLSVKVLGHGPVQVPAAVEVVSCKLRAPARFRDLEHDLKLPHELVRVAADVVHSPAQHPPRRSPRPWIQTLHDLTPLTWPHPLLARDRRHWQRAGPRLLRASAVVTVSRFSADEGIRHLGLDARRIHVIPNGVDPGVFHPGDDREDDDPFVLHVAAWGPHKGFDEAMRVVARLAEAGLPHRLLLVGPQDAWMRSQIDAAVARSPRPDRVEVVGFVDDLADVYRRATALLMTSRCEGFGLPALEAMACGTPVIAFRNSSLPEVVGDGGVLVGDGDEEAMATAVRRLVASPGLRSEFAERGLAQSTRFRWPAAIEAYAALMMEVGG